MVPNLSIDSPVELPAYEEPDVSPEKESTTAGLESKSYASMILAGDRAATSNAGLERLIKQV